MKDVVHQSDWVKIDDVIDPSSRLEYSIAKNIEYGKTYKFIVTAWNEYGESVKDDRSANAVNTTADIPYTSGMSTLINVKQTYTENTKMKKISRREIQKDILFFLDF
jgi:hypothetical protein